MEKAAQAICQSLFDVRLVGFEWGPYAQPRQIFLVGIGNACNKKKQNREPVVFKQTPILKHEARGQRPARPMWRCVCIVQTKQAYIHSYIHLSANSSHTALSFWSAKKNEPKPSPSRLLPHSSSMALADSSLPSPSRLLSHSSTMTLVDSSFPFVHLTFCCKRIIGDLDADGAL